MPRAGGMFGPDVTFLGVERCDLDDPATWQGADVVIIGAPYDAGDIEMPGVEARVPLDRLEAAVRTVAEGGAIPVILGGDHTITWPDVTGVARAVGWGRVSVTHFAAHADTGDVQ